MKKVAWSPDFTYPGADKNRVWTAGEPSQDSIDYWAAQDTGILYAYSDDDGAAEVLQNLGWTLVDGVWTEDKAATADLKQLSDEPIGVYRRPGRGLPSGVCLHAEKEEGLKDGEYVYVKRAGHGGDVEEMSKFVIATLMSGLYTGVPLTKLAGTIAVGISNMTAANLKGKS